MPIVENLSSFINNPGCPLDSVSSKDELTNTATSMDTKFKNTKTHSSIQLTDHEKQKQEMAELPLSFASFYYSLKVSKGKDEREDVQKKTFAKWINSQLIKIKAQPVRDLFMDLRDGTVLIKLLEILTGKELKKEVGRMKVHHMGNVNIALQTLRDNKVRITNINANDIVEGNPKLTLGLVWQVIQHWQVRDVLRTAVYDIHTTNLEKALLTWCQNSTKDYYDVNIKDFTSSWKNGLAFNALIHKHRPHLFDYNELVERRDNYSSNMKYAEYTLENAFSIAHEKLQIERLLDIEDVITDYPDKKSIMMYVMCYFQVLSKPHNQICSSNVTESIKLAALKSDKATLTQSFADNLTEAHRTIENINTLINESSQLASTESNNKATTNQLSCELSSNTTNQNNNNKPVATDLINNHTNENTQLDDINSIKEGMASISVSSASSSTTTSPVLENYLLDLKKVIEWLVTSEQQLSEQSDIGEDVNNVKGQFQTHEDFMLDLTKHQNNVGLVLQEGSRLINSGTISTEEDAEVRKQMKLLNDMWEGLRLKAVERQAKLHERLMKLQTEQLNQMDIWLTNAENRISNINQLADSFEGLSEQKEELSILQDDLVKEQEAVDCLKQIIVVVDDNTDDQAFTDLENKLSSLSDRWSNVCKFVGNRWFTVQDLIIKLQSIETDFNDLNTWISAKSTQLNILVEKTRPLVASSKLAVSDRFGNDLEIDTESPYHEDYAKLEFNSSAVLIKILKEIELEMQAMHAKLNDMNEIGEQIGTQLNNSPQLSNSINSKMDTLEFKWNSLLEKMEYLSRICTEQQQIELGPSTNAKGRSVLQPIDECSSSVVNQRSSSSTMAVSSSQVVNTVITETDENSESSELQVDLAQLNEEEIKQYTNIDMFVSHLNGVLDQIKSMVLTDDLSPEEQGELIQKAHAELIANQRVLENIHQIGGYLADSMAKEGRDSSELEATVQEITRKWHETQEFVDRLQANGEKSSASRKAFDELATLKDVHEGYQRYINNVEALSADEQKLTLQSETNKVKLKGMNSYEPRLNDLKQLTNQLDNTDLINEIKSFALKWSETYALINIRNEDILNNQQQQKLRKQQQTLQINNNRRLKEEEHKLHREQDNKSTHMMASLSTKNHTSSSSIAQYNAQNRNDDLENSDDDILHVVTNVYTIPIVKSTSAGNGPFISDSSHQLKVTASCDEQLYKSEKHQNLVTANSSSQSMQKQNTSSSTNENLVCTGKSLTNNVCASSESAHNKNQNNKIEVNSNMSKFQIKSIVEIYEKPPEEQEQDKCTLKNSGHFEETTTKEVITEDDRENAVPLKELTHQPSESYMESKRVVLDWLNQIETSLTANDCKITFLPVLEDRLLMFKDIQNEINAKRSNIDYLQQNAEDIAEKSTVELNVQIKSDLKHLRSRYQNIIDSVQDRCDKLEHAISDLKEFDSDYLRIISALNKIESHSQIEHHSSTPFGLSHGKSIEAELDNLKQIKYDLESLGPNMRKINEHAEKYLHEIGLPKSQIDAKFQNKIKDDIVLINEQFKQLNKNYTKTLAYLEEAHKKSTKVDNEIDALDHWITMKSHEIPEDEGIIINEEQFEQRILKYKQMKAEIERRNDEVKRIIDTGNDMLKNSSGGVSNVADLARCLVNINNKWANLNMKVDAKNKLYDQLSEWVNDLRQLLHEEKNWLERLERKVNTPRSGADAEELSEELDNIETFIKSHSTQSKERIGELSSALIERQVMIMLANSDTKEFLYRWQLLHEDAARKMQELDAAINDVQNWERRLLELKEWVNYMDKYLTTRIDQDIFADDVPEDFARIGEEFVHNEHLLKELDEGVDKYKQHGERLGQQMNVMKKNWADVNHKFKKFQKPADFDQKLNKIQKMLDDIEQALYMIEVNSEDADTIHLQLEHCMKFYKTLSELKGQIEVVLKQGRSIVDKKQVDNTEELTRQLDQLKQKYNDLGSRVTNGKNELERAFKISKKFRKEYNVISDFMGKIDGEMRKIEQKPLSKNYTDELEWIKNTKAEICKVETNNLETMSTLRKQLDELLVHKSGQQATSCAAKIQDIEEKVANMQRRIDERAEFLHSEADKLEDQFQNFLEGSRHVSVQIEKLQGQLMDAESVEATRDAYDVIEREVNVLLSDVELVRVQGSELCSKSEQYCKTVEQELRSLLGSFEELNRRLNMAQENQEIVTKTETQHNRHQESRHIRRYAKSPSEASMDSTVDVFDSELRQKYMRAVAYLRILDEAPIMEHDDMADEYRTERTTDGVDIDFVIQQARQVAQLNEHTNPERSRRILEKVHKLEQRWCASKSKRDNVRSTHVIRNHQVRSQGVNDQINILEEKLTEYKAESSGDDWEGPRIYYGPSDFIYDHDQSFCCHDNVDSHSVVAEQRVQQCVPQVIQQQEPLTFIRKYVTTKTTTTIPGPQYAPVVNEHIVQSSKHHQNQQMASSMSNMNMNQYLMQPIATGQQQARFRCASTQNTSAGFQQASHHHQQQQQQQAGFRSASIPPPQRFQFEELNNSQTNAAGGNSSTRFYSSSSHKTTNEQQPQPVITSKSSSSYRNSTASKTFNTTLPVNYSHNNQSHMSSSNSCMDYANSTPVNHFNGNAEWTKNQQHLIKPVPHNIPIHQE